MSGEHLDTIRLAELTSGTGEEGARRHLQECRECRDELARLQGGIAQTVEQMRAQAERDEVFWARQRAAIRARSAGSRQLWLRYASTAMATLLLVAVLLFAHTPKLAKPLPSDAPSDEVLLEQVQNDIQRDVPQALAALSSDQE